MNNKHDIKAILTELTFFGLGREGYGLLVTYGVVYLVVTSIVVVSEIVVSTAVVVLSVVSSVVVCSSVVVVVGVVVMGSVLPLPFPVRTIDNFKRVSSGQCSQLYSRFGLIDVELYD